MFDDETENGKIFISYPCVESLRDISDPEMFYSVAVHMYGTDYKDVVGSRCDYNLQSFKRYNYDTWRFLIDMHLKKMNYIVEDAFTYPSRVISQSEIFNSQIEGFIIPNKEVGVLSAFPVFIHDYFGNIDTILKTV